MIAELIGKILAYVDRPWKAVAVAGLLILGGGGFFIWDMRDKLFLTSLPKIMLDRSKLPIELGQAMVETGADIAAVWSIDLPNNGAYFEQGRQKSDGAWEFTPHRIPVIAENRNTRYLADILAGHPVCDGDSLPSLFARRFVDDGMKRVCAVPIPYRSDVVVGIFVLAWRAAPDRGHEEAAIGIAGELANKLVSRD